MANTNYLIKRKSIVFQQNLFFGVLRKKRRVMEKGTEVVLAAEVLGELGKVAKMGVWEMDMEVVAVVAVLAVEVLGEIGKVAKTLVPRTDQVAEVEILGSFNIKREGGVQ